jgi:hypothetical protein
LSLFERGAKRHLLYFRQQAHTLAASTSHLDVKSILKYFAKSPLRLAGEIKAREVERDAAVYMYLGS